MTPVHVRAEVHRVERVGAYTELTVVAPPIAQQVRPGNFLTVGIGDETSSMLLRRSFAVAGAEEWGIPGGTVRFVVAVSGRGTAWITARRPGDVLDLVGPLGRPFRLPRGPVGAVLVGGGYGAAPLVGLAAELRARGGRVEVVVGASTASRLYGVEGARGVAHRVHVVTEDGTAGERGRVTDALAAVVAEGRMSVVYACGPMGMLAAVTEQATAAGLAVEVSVEEAMACGIGVCMTCVLPVVGSDGRTRMVRSCVEGPVFPGTSVRFDDVGTVPPDALGADAMAGH